MNRLAERRAKIHSDFRSKGRTQGIKINQQGTIHFGRCKGGHLVPQRNAGLAMPLHPASGNREPQPLDPAIVALRDWMRKKLQQDIRQQCGQQKVFDMTGWIEQRAVRQARQLFDAGFRVVTGAIKRFRRLNVTG